MDYNRLYQRFIESRSTRTRQRNDGLETHHIIPRSIGGGNGRDNLIHLTAREHFLAHRILFKMYSGKERIKMGIALTQFFRVGQTARRYDRLKAEILSVYKSKEWRDMCKERSLKYRQSYINCWTDERKRARSEAMKQRWADPLFRAKTLKGINTTENRQRLRNNANKLWQDPQHISKVKQGHKRAGTGSWTKK